MKQQLHKILDTKWGKIAFWIIWPAFVFYSVQYIIPLVLWMFVGDNLASLANNAVFSTVYSAVVYVIILAGVFYIPKYAFGQKITKKDIGVTGLPTWTDIGLGFAGLIVAMLLAGILSAIATSIIPGFDPSEAQDVGFSNLSQSYQFIMAFIALVVVAPAAEELIFRGVIYGEMRKVKPYLATIIVSLMFGIAHGQLNVSITTFAMSLVMCFMREKLTGTVWSTIILHMIKNAVAFYFLFIAPEILQSLPQ